MKKLYVLAFVLAPFCANAQNLVYSSSFQGNANDISGNNLNAAVYGATLTTGESGISNTAYYFDGVNDSIVIPASPLTNLTQWTLHARVQPQGFYTGLCQGNWIIGHGPTYYDDHYHMEYFDNVYDNDCSVQTNSQSRWAAVPAGSSNLGPFLNGPVVALNTWYCLVARYDGSTVKLSVNGNQVASFAWSNQYTTAPVGGRPTYIGTSAWHPNYPYWFQGKIDKISIYDGAISDSLTNALCTGLDDTLGGTTSVTNAYNVDKVAIGPNPAHERLNIILPSAQHAEIVISNALGQVLRKVQLETQYATVNISELPAGIYIVNVRGEGLKQTLKFIKQ